MKARSTAARLILDRELARVLPTLPRGDVLDVGSKDAPYRPMVPANTYLTMDLEPRTGVDVVADIHSIPRDDASFDTVVATEVLEHCRRPQVAVDEIHRVLRQGGTCVLSTRFLYPAHGRPDYFRFTDEGLRELFSRFDRVEVIPLGGRLVSAWMLFPRRGFALRWVTGLVDPLFARRGSENTKAACGYLVLARR